MDIKPVDVASAVISYHEGNLQVSSNQNAQCGSIFSGWIRHLTNGDWSGTFWQPADDDKYPWIEIDLGNTENFSNAVIYESGHNIKSFELQYKSGKNG